MLILPFDCETIGLPVWDKPSDDPCQPRITQIACELVDDETGIVHAAFHTLIKPDGWTVPPEVVALNGITTEMCEKYGVPMKLALPMFLGIWRQSQMRVAHNEGFDMRMVRIEIKRAGGSDALADEWKAAPKFCTMKESKPIVNPGKNPKLSEAYKFFTGNELVGAHSAVADMLGCKAVYMALKKKNGHATPI